MTGVWIVSYVVLWVAVAVLLVMVFALLRHVGVLHGRLDALAAVVPEADVEEGPELGSTAPLQGRLGYGRAPMTLVAFVAEGCELSAAVVPALRVVDKQYGDAVRVVELSLGSRTIGAFEAFKVEATPFVVAVDREGVVRAKGRSRSLAQLEDLVASAGAAALAAAKSARVEGLTVDVRTVSSAPVVVEPEPVVAEPVVAEPVVAEPEAASAPEHDTAGVNA